jgi:hypothetical protein
MQIFYETTFAGTDPSGAEFSHADLGDVCIKGAKTDGTIWPKDMTVAEDGPLNTPHCLYVSERDPPEIKPSRFPCKK